MNTTIRCCDVSFPLSLWIFLPYANEVLWCESGPPIRIHIPLLTLNDAEPTWSESCSPHSSGHRMKLLHFLLPCSSSIWTSDSQPITRQRRRHSFTVVFYLLLIFLSGDSLEAAAETTDNLVLLEAELVLIVTELDSRMSDWFLFSWNINYWLTWFSRRLNGF